MIRVLEEKRQNKYRCDVILLITTQNTTFIPFLSPRRNKKKQTPEMMMTSICFSQNATPRNFEITLAAAWKIHLQRLTRLWRHYLQTSHPLTEAWIVKMEKTIFQLCPLFNCQRSKLRKSCLLLIRRIFMGWY